MPTGDRQLPLPTGVRKALLPRLLSLALAVVPVVWWGCRTPATTALSGTGASSTQAVAHTGAVGCLGYIEPPDGVLQVTAPYLEGRPQRVLELKVKQGDQVHQGQLLAILDGRQQLQAGLHLANARVDLARARLSQVTAGASGSDVAAQKAAVSQLQAALENARSEYHRYEVLHQQTDVSAADLDARKLNVQTSEHKLEEAQERLKSISQVRPTDIDVAQSDLRVASAEAESARVNLNLAMVHSYATGRVLKIHAYPGEEAGPQGLLELGKSGPMYVEAEVYETEITRVHPGQQAAITSDLFSGTISGVVETVGATIDKAAVLPLDPVAYADQRVFKVWIRLNDGDRVAGLIHGKVNVVIQP
jgi:HlyD family secretion protein